VRVCVYVFWGVCVCVCVCVRACVRACGRAGGRAGVYVFLGGGCCPVYFLSNSLASGTIYTEQNSSDIPTLFHHWHNDAAGGGDDAIQYNSAEGEEAIKNIAGTAYVFLVGLFLTRVLSRRAKRAREQVGSLSR